MKKIIICSVVALLALDAYAQVFEISPEINLGTGRIYSGNLVENFNYRNDIDQDVLTWDVKQKFGFTFGLGACFQYNINDKISIFCDPAYHSLSQKITIDYFKNDLDGNGDGDIKTITSQAIIKTTWFSAPLLAQYGFGNDQKFWVSGGFEFAFTGTPKIESDETKITESYVSNVLIDNRTEVAKVSSTLNEFKSLRTNFIVGIGTSFNISGKNLYLDFRYRHPLTKSTMYTTDGNYEDKVYKNNEVFDIWGKADAELDAPQFRLDDYRLGTIDIAVRYVIFKK